MPHLRIVNGRPVYVDDFNRPIRMSRAQPGLPNDADIMSRLPDAHIVGMTGPGVVPIDAQPYGARNPDAPDGLKTPVPDFRPLAGLQVINRGRLVVLPNDTGIATVGSIVETPKDNGDDAELITVTTGFDFDGQAEGATLDVLVQLQMNLTWGVGGAFFKANLDWLQGQAFTICAKFVRVGATYQSLPPGFGGPGPALTLQASLGYGGDARLMPRLTQAAGGLLAVGATTTVAIPRFATSFAVSCMSSPNPFDLAINCVTNTGAGASTRASYRYNDSTNFGRQDQETYPIPADCRFLRVTNNGGAVLTPSGFSILWNMSL